MARVVLAVAASRSPMLSAPPDMWPLLGDRDRTRQIRGRDGNPVSFAELLERAAPSIAEELTAEKFKAKHAAAKRALETVCKAIEQARPDLVLLMGDDEEENIHDDNRPAMSVFWGETYRNIPRKISPDADALTRATASAWGVEEAEYPVAARLGKHLIESLIDAEFDVGSSRFQKAGESMPHGFGFMYHQLLKGHAVPSIPIILNVHSPPNQPTAKRLYEFGKACRDALEATDDQRRVAVIATGGLSVGIVDEELDRLALSGMQSRSVSILASLPRTWMQGSQGEVLCWIAAAGAADHLTMEIVDYLPGYRSPAGTGCGLAFAVWK